MTRILLFAGSFDPVTRGHLDLITRASQLGDRLIVAVGTNTKKTPRFSVQQRLDFLRRVTAALPNVDVQEMSGSLIAMAEKHHVAAVVKGVRGSADLDWEMTQATVNHELAGVETLFLPSRPNLAHVSSSLVRELLYFGMDVSRYVPSEILPFVGDNERE